MRWILGVLLGCMAIAAPAQHLWWSAPKTTQNYTCLYGEITVLATSKTIYYCGCNWWPGAQAGGYTGIQDTGDEGHRMIFSIWDTSNELHPAVVQAIDPAHASRFGGEGTGAHTHIAYDWKVGQTYKFFAVKKQSPDNKATFTSVFYFDEPTKKWVKEATISSPNGGFPSVTNFNGALCSFLENWSGQERAKPKLATYRLWIGTEASKMMSLTDAGGDGKWGKLNGEFYLAEGDDSALGPYMSGADSKGEIGGKEPMTISSKPLSRRTLRELISLERQAGEPKK